MPLQTTVVGAYPKPSYLKIPDWFLLEKPDPNWRFSPADYNVCDTSSQEMKALQDRAINYVINEQQDLGIDVITDGEVTRENYFLHFCRHVKGIDFEKLTERSLRNGACKQVSPTIVRPVVPLSDKPWYVDEWRTAQNMATVPVKATLPGPMCLVDSLQDEFYNNDERLSLDLVASIRREVLALAAGGCKHIQIDEPILVRKPDVALQYGIQHLVKCFEGVPSDVQRIVHACCGYPNYLDEEGYEKADKGAYLQIADALDEADVDAVSIEDAHRRNDLELFRRFKKTTIILGVVAIANSRVETQDEIRSHVQDVLQSFPASQLILAPDCGLGFLPRDLIQKKITNMVTVAKQVV